MDRPPPTSGLPPRPRAVFFPWLGWPVFAALFSFGLWNLHYVLTHDVPYNSLRHDAIASMLIWAGLFLERPVLLFSGDRVYVIRCFGLYWRRVRATDILKLVLPVYRGGEKPAIARIDIIHLVLRDAESFVLWYGFPSRHRKIAEEFRDRWNIPLEFL